MPGDQDVATITHRSGLGAWERAVGRPSRPLRGVVQRYTGYRRRLATPAAHRGIPGASLPLVIDLGPPQTITLPDTGRPPVRVGSFVAGPHDRHVTIEADEFHGIQVDLDPATVLAAGERSLAEVAAMAGTTTRPT